MNFEDLKFMSIGSSCVYLACISKDVRLRGPVDNIKLKNIKALKILLENRFFDYIKNTSYKTTRKKLGDFQKGDCEIISDFPDDTFTYIHNLPSGDHFFNNLKIRCDNLKEFLNKVTKDDNSWLLFSLSGSYVEYGTGKLINNQLYQILSYLKDKNLLNKTILIGSHWKTINYKIFNHYLNKESINQLRKTFNFNYIELDDVDYRFPKETQKQFKNKVINLLNNLKKGN